MSTLVGYSKSFERIVPFYNRLLVINIQLSNNSMDSDEEEIELEIVDRCMSILWMLCIAVAIFITSTLVRNSILVFFVSGMMYAFVIICCYYWQRILCIDYCRQKESVCEIEMVEIVSSEKCTICLEDCKTAVKMKCGHIFHEHCIDTWLEESTTCPLCRRDLIV